MGQKVHPRALRLGIIRDWDARWFADKKQFSRLLHEDLSIRDHIKRKMYAAGISRVEIERAANRLKLTIYTGRPGMVIGRGGAGVEELRRSIERITDKQVAINIVEVKVPELDAQLVAENVAAQLEKRISFRRAMKQAVSRAMKLGARGVKVICSGRLGGAEIARRERYVDGTVPLHTLRADIDYGLAEAHTTYGRIGVKVWVCKGEPGAAGSRPARAGAEQRAQAGGRAGGG
ncbi:MAG: 30S ribosomal protein S3 [Acetobacteraceae bacterium]|nr:30S ribosomal protein S3 [Acetobacteraceae bacterium]